MAPMRMVVGMGLLALGLAACVGDVPTGGVGQKDGPCFPNSTCNEGLQCVSGTCRKLSVDGGPCVLGKSTVGNCTLTR
jgi:hypothetical protein